MSKEMNYEDLLNRGKKQIPDEISDSQRLEIPKVKGHIQGNKTILSNFLQIAKLLDRPPEQILKFILKELATAGEIKNTYVMFNNKIAASKINEKIEKFSNLFVICKECGKPETKLIKENNINIIKCQACGAKYTVSYRI